jgi:hypothetical protein
MARNSKNYFTTVDNGFTLIENYQKVNLKLFSVFISVHPWYIRIFYGSGFSGLGS